MKKLLGTVAASVLLALAGATSASAHAVSIGYENFGPGSVAVWLGTYQHGGHHLEGSMNLLGVNGNPYASTTNPFTLAAGSGAAGWTGLANYQGPGKPGGLIDGSTNFYADGATGSVGLTDTETPFLLACPACGPTNHWQGAVFNGLTPGDYQFTWVPIINPTQEWTPFNDDFNGVFTISGTVINPGNPNAVPLPAGLPLLAGALSLLGFGAWRRKKA